MDSNVISVDKPCVSPTLDFFDAPVARRIRVVTILDDDGIRHLISDHRHDLAVEFGDQQTVGLREIFNRLVIRVYGFEDQEIFGQSRAKSWGSENRSQATTSFPIIAIAPTLRRVSTGRR